MLASTLFGKTILVAGNEETRMLVAVLLRQNGCAVAEVDSAQQACRLLEQRRFDLVIAEQKRITDLEGVQLLYRLEQLHLPVLLLVEPHEKPAEANWQQRQLCRYISRHAHAVQLLATVRAMIATAKAESPAMKAGMATTTHAPLEGGQLKSHLAGGKIIRHIVEAITRDFQELIQTLNSSCSYLEETIRTPEAVQFILAHLRTSSERTNKIVDELIHCLQDDTMPASLDVSEIVESSRRILAKLFGPDVGLVVTGTDASYWIESNESLFEALLLKMCAAIRDAIAPRSDCRLEIARVDQKQIDKLTLPMLGTGRYVRLAISYTTAKEFKETTEEKRTRYQGLAALAKRCGGFLTCISRGERNTTLSVWFPETEPPQPQPDLIV